MSYYYLSHRDDGVNSFSSSNYNITVRTKQIFISPKGESFAVGSDQQGAIRSRGISGGLTLYDLYYQWRQSDADQQQTNEDDTTHFLSEGKVTFRDFLCYYFYFWRITSAFVMQPFA